MDNEHKQKTRLVRLPYFHCEMNDKPRWAVTDLLRSFFMFRIIYLYNHNPPKNASENSTRTIKWYFSNANCPIMTTLLTRCKFLFHQSVRTKNLYQICITNKKSMDFFHAFSLMVPQAGIEPATQGFSVPCSTNWATEASWRTRRESNSRSSPWQGDMLTATPLVHGLALLLSIMRKGFASIFFKKWNLSKNKADFIVGWTFFGCREWIWTNDLRVMSPTSYQTALPCDMHLLNYIITTKYLMQV